MGKIIRPNPHRHEKQIEHELPGFKTLAQDILKKWEPGTNSLVAVLAEGLAEAHRMGFERIAPKEREGVEWEQEYTRRALSGEGPPPPRPQRTKRTRSRKEEEPPKRRTRLRRR